MTDEDIKKEFLKSNNQINSAKIRNYINKINYNEEILNYLLNRYEGVMNLNEIVYRIIHNIEVLPKCKTCGKELPYNTYHNFCSQKCAQNNTEVRNKNKETFFKNYEGDKKEKLANKKRNTWKLHFANNIEKNKLLDRRKQTCLEKYGVEYHLSLKDIQEKRKQTCLEKYGVDNAAKNINVIKKIQEKRKLKNDQIIKNIKKTCLEKYGVDNVFKSEKIKQKIRKTTLEKYGVEHIMYLPEVVNKIANSEIRKQREIETKRKNNSFNTSKPEDESFNLLKEKYPDVIRQHRSDLYPFACDFYIPSLDLYIECNYGWTHGIHPYNKDNKEDQLIVEQWKEKNTKYYDNAIKTWTIRDVKKRNIAKQNNLNYIEFWNINELKDWLMS